MRRLLLALLLLTAPAWGAAVESGVCELEAAGSHTGDVNYTTVLTCLASNFTAGDYEFTVRAMVGGSSVSVGDDVGWRVTQGSTPTLIPGQESTLRVEVSTAGGSQGYYLQGAWFTFTQPATPVDLQLQVVTEDSAQTVHYKLLQIAWQRKDGMNSADYQSAQSSTPVTLNDATWVDGASVTFTATEADEVWGIEGAGQIDVIDTGGGDSPFELRINCDDSILLPFGRFDIRVEDSELILLPLSRPISFSAASHTCKIQARHTVTVTTDSELDFSHIRALRLASRATFSSVYGAGPVTVAGTSNVPPGAAWDLAATVPAFTPTVTGPHMVSCFSGHESDASAPQQAWLRVQSGGADIPTGIGANLVGRAWDVDINNELTPLAYSHYLSLSNTEKTITMDVESREAASSFYDNSCYAYSMELAAEAAVLVSTIQTSPQFGFWRGPFRVQPVSYPDAEEEVAYTGPTPVVVNGKTPITWSANGTLPSGLSISSTTGVISGTPAAGSAGTYPHTLVATSNIGGKAFREVSLTVIDTGSGSLTWVTETAEDGNLTADPPWTTPGGCSVTTLGVLEGSNEVSKTTSTDCVLVDNIDAPEIYVGWDEYRDVCPATDRSTAIVVLGSSDEELATVLIETDCDMFVKTPGQVGDAGRGFKIIQAFSTDADRDRRVDFHFATGTGGDAVLRARTDNGTIQEFSAGTATANVDRVIFRQENDAAGDFVRDRITIDDAEWANLDAIMPDSPPPDSQPWIYSLSAPLRTHYVDDGACGGAGTIGDPECWEDALSNAHYQCGDQHLFRAGTSYRAGDTTILQLNNNCSQSAPAVFKGYVDPATGQPERVRFVSHFELNGNWTWLVGLEFTDEVSTGNKNMVELQCDGCMVINSVLYENRYTDNMNVWNSAQNVVYGNVLYRPSPLDTTLPHGHNIYTQNDFNADGWKYFVQNISLENVVGSSRLFHINVTSAGTTTGYHLQDNFFGEGVGQVDVFNGASGGHSFKIKFHQNYFVDHGSTSSHRSVILHPQPNQFEFTDNYFARANFAPEGYWGTTRPEPGNIFTGNEIYDPLGGDHIQLLKAGNTKNVDGASKIHDGDVWDNNTYGGTFRAGTLWCNGSSATNRTLAQWRTATDNCRLTPDAGDANGFDINSTEVANPTVNKIVVLKNEWQCPACTFNDQARGNIYIVNWENATSDIVDISSVVGVGKTYTVRYARDFYGTAAASGTCPGSGACNVSLLIRRSDGEGTTLFTGAYVITGQP